MDEGGVGRAGPGEVVMRPGASRGSPRWSGRVANVTEDRACADRINENGQDPDGPFATRAREHVYAIRSAKQVGPGQTTRSSGAIGRCAEGRVGRFGGAGG